MYQVNSWCIALLVFILFSSKIHAQDISFEYNNQNSIESIKHNAAYFPKDHFHLKSSIHSNFSSTNLSIHSIFNNQENQIGTITSLINDSNLQQMNFNLSSSLNVLTVGFRLNSKLYCGFNSNIQLNQQLNLDKNIPGLIFLGNSDTHYFGRPININLNNNQLRILNQNRVSIGYRYSDKLSFGLGISAINALYRIKTQSSSFELLSTLNDSSIYEIQNKANIRIETNGFNSFNSIINPVDLLLLRKPSNLSAVFDLGGIFRFNQYLRFSASLKNLGSLNWSNNRLIHRIQSEQITFTGFQLPLQYNGAETPVKDSLFKWYDYNVLTANEPFSEKLNIGYHFSVEFFANPNHVFQYIYGNGYQIFNSNSIHSFAYKFNFNNFVFGSVSVSSNPLKKREPIFSGGLGFRFGPIQIQSSIYNFLAFNQINSPFQIGANIGIALVLGRQSDKDGDGILDSKDKCPNRFGSSKNQGCPKFYKFKNHIILH